jgi:DIS3-like exonuclease 1
MLATQAMSEALYFSTGDFEEDQFYHYGLAASFYTHFTSPIRRYADVIVHRLLSEAIRKENSPNPQLYTPVMTQSEVATVCRHINVCNRNAKLASMDSTKLFHSLYFKLMQESNGELRGVRADGVIFSINRNGFVVFVPEYGLKGLVYLTDASGNSLIPVDGLKSKQAKFNNAQLSGTFQFDKERDVIQLDSTRGPVSVGKFSHCSVEIAVRESK